MKFLGALVLGLSFFSTVSFADCAALEAKSCVEVKLKKVIEDRSKFCVANTKVSGLKKTTKVFFQECPAKGSVLKGDLKQRSDITIEGMAACQYEFVANAACGK